MIQKLHIRLTALCSAITGLVLAILTVICLMISESGIRTQENAAFLTNLNTMYENLEVQTALSHNWIRQMEFHYRFTIRLFDNGTPLFYQQLSNDPVTDALVEQSIQKASGEFHLDPAKPSKTSVARSDVRRNLRSAIQTANRTTSLRRSCRAEAACSEPLSFTRSPRCRRASSGKG